ncbi:hypothetical protein K458DRAFT_89212 [Lentithecium fluviatile CBS 122367]|uniref:Uncharacterized protein n=1 Tax=Lentithecium fluviatile CBS 122367 TaxID=1168545 RepID=A0A6G1IRW0_9PLEO|nr:hypothetical protein K458DRAFT_89212 [Lentithecium fluviatile CBS 122367]
MRPPSNSTACLVSAAALPYRRAQQKKQQEALGETRHSNARPRTRLLLHGISVRRRQLQVRHQVTGASTQRVEVSRDNLHDVSTTSPTPWRIVGLACREFPAIISFALLLAVPGDEKRSMDKHHPSRRGCGSSPGARTRRRATTAPEMDPTRRSVRSRSATVRVYTDVQEHQAFRQL